MHKVYGDTYQVKFQIKIICDQEANSEDWNIGFACVVLELYFPPPHGPPSTLVTLNTVRSQMCCIARPENPNFRSIPPSHV